jgi:ABC-type antimicrobial peptide transport system permease subunit
MDDMRERFAEPLGLPPDAISGAFLKADPQYTESIRARLQQIDGVALVQTKAELEAQLDALTAYSRLFIGFMFLLGAGMAFAVTYTATDNVLWERTRELATLRTLGFGMKSISRLVSIENLMMGFLGTLSGVYPGYWLARYLGDANQTEGFSMDTVVFPRTYAIAILGVLLVVLIAQRPGLRRILTLDLAEAVRMRGE